MGNFPEAVPNIPFHRTPTVPSLVSGRGITALIMNPVILLGEGDRSALSALLHHQLPGLIPHPRSYDTLSGFIGSSRICDDDEILDVHVGLGDLVILSSPKHSRSVRVVLPQDARDGTERISVLSPLGLSILGRKVGSTVGSPSSGGQHPVLIREVLKGTAAPAFQR